VAALIIAMVLVAGGVGVYAAMSHAGHVQTMVVNDLQKGADELQLAKAAVVKANSKDGGVTELKQADSHFQAARVDFRHVLDQVNSDLVLRGAQIAPGVGQSYIEPRLSSVAAIARMGVDLCDAGLKSTQIVAAFLDQSNGSKSGARILAAMSLAVSQAPAIKAALEGAKAEADKVDVSLLPSGQRASFAKAKSDIGKGLKDMTQFQQLAPALVELLGGNGKRTYLVEQPDPAELRAGGGFIGSYSVITVDKGDVTLGKAGNTNNIDAPYPRPGQPKYVRPPGPLFQFASWHGYIFGDSNFLPDFPQSAVVGEKLFEQETGTKVDGVISIDPWAVAGMLSITGPIAVPEWHTTVDANTFVEQVFQQLEKVTNLSSNRKEFLSAVAGKLIARITTLHSSDWPKLIAVLNGLVTERHLQVYVNSGAAQTMVDSIGWSGAVAKPTASQETLLEVESNFGADKVNHWLSRSYHLVLTVQNGKLHHSLSVNYVNPSPPGYQGGQSYRCYLRLYFSGTASGARSIGPVPNKAPTDEPHPGFGLLDGWFSMHGKTSAGAGTATMRFEWDTTWDGTSARQIYWQKQPGTLADRIKITFINGGKTYSASTDIGQDRVLVLSATGIVVKAGSAGLAQLPLIGASS